MRVGSISAALSFPEQRLVIEPTWGERLLKYSKILKISPSMYKPLQILAPQTRNAKNPLLNCPSKYKAPGGLVLGNCPQIQSKRKQKW